MLSCLFLSSTCKVVVWNLYILNTCTFQVWNSMLSDDVFVAAEVCQDAWTFICCQVIKQRVDPVSIIH